MLDALDYECFGTTVSLVKNEEENIVTKLTNLYKSLEKSKCVNKLSIREKKIPKSMTMKQELRLKTTKKD